MSAPSRRELLVLAAATGAGAVLAPSLVPAGNPPAAPLRLAALVRDVDGATLLGRHYLRQAPHEASRAVLVDRVARALGATSVRDDADAVARLLRAVRADFAAGRAARADGWVLAVTELRLAALVALGGRA